MLQWLMQGLGDEKCDGDGDYIGEGDGDEETDGDAGTRLTRR